MTYLVLSVAIVCMVNHTALKLANNISMPMSPNPSKILLVNQSSQVVDDKCSSASNSKSSSIVHLHFFLTILVYVF